MQRFSSTQRPRKTGSWSRERPSHHPYADTKGCALWRNDHAPPDPSVIAHGPWNGMVPMESDAVLAVAGRCIHFLFINPMHCSCSAWRSMRNNYAYLSIYTCINPRNRFAGTVRGVKPSPCLVSSVSGRDGVSPSALRNRTFGRLFSCGCRDFACSFQKNRNSTVWPAD